MRFPQEILDCILDWVPFIDDPGRPTLQACALASSHFLHGCRKYMFCSIHLSLNPSDDGEDTPKNSRLCDIVERTPAIAEYVRCVYLKNDEDSPSTSLARSDSRLSHMLDKLQNVAFLSLNQLNCDEILPPIKQAIFKILASPAMSQLYLYNVLNLQQVFAKCLLSGVPKIRLMGDVTFATDNHADRDGLYQLPPGFRGRLTDLYMPSCLSGQSLPLIELVSSTSHNLKNLQLIFDEGQGTRVAPIALSKHSTTLEVLELSEMTTKLDLSSTFNLERLSIGVKSPYVDDCVSMEFLNQTLSTIPVNNRLRELDISTYDVHVMALQEGILTFEEFQSMAMPGRLPPPILEALARGAEHGVSVDGLIETFANLLLPPMRGDSPLPQWKRLDEILAGETFPNLDKIKISIMMNSDQLKATLIERLLPRLHSTKRNLMEYR